MIVKTGQIIQVLWMLIQNFKTEIVLNLANRFKICIDIIHFKYSGALALTIISIRILGIFASKKQLFAFDL